MRMLWILTAAAIGLAATNGLANAQATNVAPQPGTAKRLSDNKTDAMNSRAMARSKSVRTKSSAGKRSIVRRSRGMSPALYHAGDPRFWR